MDAPSSEAEIKAGVCKVCVSACAPGRVRLTVGVRVAVEALAGRSAAEVGVAQQSGLSWRVTQAVFCLDVCVRRRDIGNASEPKTSLHSALSAALKNRRRHYTFGNFCQRNTKSH